MLQRRNGIFGGEPGGRCFSPKPQLPTRLAAPLVLRMRYACATLVLRLCLRNPFSLQLCYAATLVSRGAGGKAFTGFQFVKISAIRVTQMPSHQKSKIENNHNRRCWRPL